MPQNEEESNELAGYFNLVALRLKVKETLDDRAEEVKKLKKQLKDIDEQISEKGHEIVNIVRQRGEISGKITLDDFFN